MAYSRWNGSNWYIFWHTESGETKNEQLLAVWLAGGDYKEFTYKELIDPKFDIEKYFPNADCFDAKESIQDFIYDVDKYYKEKKWT